MPEMTAACCIAEPGQIGLSEALWLLSSFSTVYHRAFDPDLAAKECAPPLRPEDLVRIAGRLGFEADYSRSTNERARLAAAPLALAVAPQRDEHDFGERRDSGSEIAKEAGAATVAWVLLLQVDGGRALVAEPGLAAPRVVPLAELEERLLGPSLRLRPAEGQVSDPDAAASMKRDFGFAWFVLMGLLSAAFLVSCADSTPVKSDLADSALSVSWLPPCETNVAEPYFTIDLFEDGAVQYQGGPQVREVGERRTQIAPRRVRTLLRDATRAEAGAAGPTPPREGDPVRYCVALRWRGSNRTFRASGDDGRLLPFLAALGDALDVRRWVCPERYPRKEWEHLLYQSGFCGGYEAREAVAFSITEDDCVGLAGRVYEGVIYYKRSYKANDGEYVTAAEGYQDIDRAEFMELILAARRSRVRQLGIEELNARVDQDYIGRRAEDLMRFKHLLDHLVGSEISGALSPSGCGGSGVSGRITLRYEYGPPVQGN